MLYKRTLSLQARLLFAAESNFPSVYAQALVTLMTDRTSELDRKELRKKLKSLK